MVNAPGTRDNSVHSVDRAISILQALAREEGAGVTEISAALNLHKSTVARLLGTLESRGLVEQSSSRGRYRVGYGMVQLAAGATKRHDLSVISRPVCQKLAETAGETVTVNVAADDGRSVLGIDQVIGSATLTTMSWVGKRTPVHATSSGKIFLAHMPAAELEAYLAGGLERYTEHTIVAAGMLKRQLAVVREEGFSQVLEEHEIGLAAVAAPIRSRDGRVIAALTISGPTFRIGEDTLPGLARLVVAAAAEISERNGYRGRG